MKSLSRGLDNLATANNSFASLYIPIVVIYTCGLLMNELYNTSPVEPVTNDGFSESLNSELLGLTNIKSDVTDSCELRMNDLAVEAEIAENNEAIGVTLGVREAETDPLDIKPAPPTALEADKAAPFNKMVPISGSNQPYEPTLVVNPLESSEVFLTPAEPEMILNILPASVNVIVEV